MSLNTTRFHYQITFAIESLLMYVYAVSCNKVITKRFAKMLSGKGLDLLEEIERGEIDLELAEEKLNKLITSLNQKLPFPTFAIYPLFHLTNEPMQVTYQIVAYQQFLTQELNFGQLNFDDEAPLFNSAISLWRKATTPDIPPKVAIQELSKLITRGNVLLPKELQYPIPNPNYYATKIHR